MNKKHTTQELFDLDEDPPSSKPSSQEMIPERQFLGWDTPLLDCVTQWLLDSCESLENTLVVVPTAHSGRRLRMALSSSGGILSPHVISPSQLFEVQMAASRQESLWAWIKVVRSLDLVEFPHLFPNRPAESTSSFSEALTLAREIMSLRDTLADGDADFRDAAFHSPEKERWQELSLLESRMLKQLGTWKLTDSVLAKRQKAQAPTLPPGVDRIIVACVPDPTPLAARTLKTHLTNGVPITILIHAPASEADSFDPWGTPVHHVWAEKQIDIPDWKNRLKLVDSAPEAAEACIEIFAEEKTTTEHAALALCDASFAPLLEKKFADASWPLYDPEGKGFADSGLMRILHAMQDISGKQATFASLQEMVKLPGAEIFFPPQTTRHLAARMMDALHHTHLPESVSDARFLASPEQKKLIDSITSKLSTLQKGKLTQTLRSWLSSWLEQADQAVLKAAEPCLAEALDALDRLESNGDSPTPQEAFAMLAESLNTARISAQRSNTVLDLQGWLEISYDPAPHLILVGMHEGCVPDGKVDDLFIPDSLRKNLGLRDSQGRFARDAFLLQSALTSRLKNGRVDAVLARFNDAGEARKPSRLLMRQSGEKLASIVNHLFAESKSNQSKVGPWTRDWTLSLPKIDNPYSEQLERPPRSLSPSAIKDYMSCPLRFFLKRIVGMHAFDSEKREMDALDFGNLCHHVVDLFGKNPALRDSSDADEINSAFSKMLDERVKELYGTRLSLPLMVQMESARERLRAFAQQQASDRANGWHIIETEFQVGRNGIPWEFHGHPINMFIDRIDRFEDGQQWRVWDYKTYGKAKHPVEQHQATWNAEENRPLLGELIPASGRKKERRWADVQLPLYAAFVQQHYHTDHLPQVGYISLPRAVTDVQFCPWSDFDEATLEHALTWAMGAIEKIRAGHFQQATTFPAQERDWDDFEDLAPDGLATAFNL